ncbi:hypothetical protein NM208_g9351 [Fusarium decemcellulare]|uniref:Uncharacterized protein n=1 Tax=Fusarium decemcellulare TaxID=57161 RepID=A0ACC1S239_9HYPO|nr:hypothetical protein NM208_g9351 [Fusarium decemcellulare]
MLPSTVYRQSCFLVGMHFAVGGNAAPAETRDIQVDTIDTDASLIRMGLLMGEPEYFQPRDDSVLTTVNVVPEFIPPVDKSVHPNDVPDASKRDDSSLAPRALTADQKEALRLHNVARAKVKNKALIWDTNLETAARAWAKKVAQKGKLEHSQSATRPNQGENMAYAWSSGTYKSPMTAGTQGWLAEAKNYHGETIPQGNFSDYGHYTQCVWKTTTKIGIAAASDGKGGWYTVARYSPPGNYVNQKPY